MILKILKTIAADSGRTVTKNLEKTAAAFDDLINEYLQKEYRKANLQAERYKDIDSFVRQYLGLRKLLLAFLAAVRQVKKVVGKLICGYDGTGRRAGSG